MQKIKYPKEQMHRISYTKLTEAQIAAKLAGAALGPTSASPLSDVFAGKSLKIVTDDGSGDSVDEIVAFLKQIQVV